MIARVSIERIIAAVALDFDVTERLIISQRRHRTYSRPRHVAIYLACQLTTNSTPMIGRAFGNRDHTTVLYAHRKVAELREQDSELDGRIRNLEEKLEPKLPFGDELQLAFLTGPLFDWLHDPVRPRATLERLAA